MNPVGEEGNIFSDLFDKVPAKRAGGEQDIASVVIYLASPAGVSELDNHFSRCNPSAMLSRLTPLRAGLYRWCFCLCRWGSCLTGKWAIVIVLLATRTERLGYALLVQILVGHTEKIAGINESFISIAKNLCLGTPLLTVHPHFIGGVNSRPC